MTITINYTGTADGKSDADYKVSGTTQDGFFACYRDAYGSYFDAVTGKVTKELKDSTGADNAAATDAQVFEAFATGYLNGVDAAVTRSAKDVAARDAVAAIEAQPKTPIDIQKDIKLGTVDALVA